MLIVGIEKSSLILSVEKILSFIRLEQRGIFVELPLVFGFSVHLLNKGNDDKALDKQVALWTSLSEFHCLPDPLT